MLGDDLPDGDSLDVCRRIRTNLPPRQAPVFLLTPDHDEDSPLDDVSPDWDAVSRHWHNIERGVDALLSWAHAQPNGSDRISIQGLEIDRRRHTASIDGRALNLTPTEFRLLWTLASEPGSVYDRQHLARTCQISGNSGQARTIAVHIKAVRGKLGDRSDLIETVHGVGYRFRETQANQ
jgi:DNA-binding response OmpR family regulator